MNQEVEDMQLTNLININPRSVKDIRTLWSSFEMLQNMARILWDKIGNYKD